MEQEPICGEEPKPEKVAPNGSTTHSLAYPSARLTARYTGFNAIVDSAKRFSNKTMARVKELLLQRS
jgi:hypothetical protein